MHHLTFKKFFVIIELTTSVAGDKSRRKLRALFRVAKEGAQSAARTTKSGKPETRIT